jgi:two-component system, NarL family, response regulator LiaR
MRHHYTGEAVTSQRDTIRVLIADDHTIVRRAIKAFLAEADDIEVVGEADNGLDAVRLSKQLTPDVILMDLLMPKMDGIEATRRVTFWQPERVVLVLTSFVHDDKVFSAIKAGAQGYLLKESEPAELIHSIHRVHRGEPSLDPGTARKIMKEIQEKPAIKAPPDPLTARELEVLQLLAKGLSNDEIAAQLVISEVTVRTHISHLLSKLHLVNKVQAALYALREGISSLEDENV